MRTREELKAEWLTYGFLGDNEVGVWARNRIASLFDIEHPSEAQASILHEAYLHISLSDLPRMAYPDHDEVLIALVKQEAGKL